MNFCEFPIGNLRSAKRVLLATTCDVDLYTAKTIVLDALNYENDWIAGFCVADTQVDTDRGDQTLFSDYVLGSFTPNGVIINTGCIANMLIQPCEYEYFIFE